MREMIKRKPKFKVGDKVKHIWSDNATTVAEITKKGYRMESGDEFVDFDDEDFWESVKEPGAEQQLKPKWELFGAGLSEVVVDKMRKDYLANFMMEITQRNTDAFGWFIDETLKFMDCGAYDEMACKGMRLFAKELKKRLGINE